MIPTPPPPVCCLCPRKCGITLWLVPTTFQASPPPPLPPPAITYPALQYQGITSSSSSCWSPYPFHLLFLLQCGSSPLFSGGAFLVSVPSQAGAGRAQLHPSSQTAHHGTTQYTAQGSRAAGLLASVIIAAQLLLQPSSFSQLVLWHLLVAAHRLL